MSLITLEMFFHSTPGYDLSGEALRVAPNSNHDPVRMFNTLLI